MKTICLNMIVKNESRVIRRCLNALKEHIDYWVILDTGSTDGTQAIIKECLCGYPGELHERPWKNFQASRNEALELARQKMDYILFVDADEVLKFLPSFEKNSLRKDYYLLKTVSAAEEFYFPKLIKDDGLWSWTQVLHEFIQHTGDVEGEILPDIWTDSRQDGARCQDPSTIYKDIAILKEAIEKEPENARYVFYLAQSYMFAKDLPNALAAYEKRSHMQGDKDETFWALYWLARTQEALELEPAIYLKSYDKAHQFDPLRAEPLERIATYYFQNDYPTIAYTLMKYGQTLPPPTPLTSAYYSWVYDFALYSIAADCATIMGKFEDAKQDYLKILQKQGGPPGLQEHVHNQLRKIEQR